MATLKPTLSDPLYTNWVKAGLVLLFTREGLQEFVKDQVNNFHKHVLNDVWQVKGLPAGTICQSCATSDVIQRGWTCPAGICHEIWARVKNSHRYKGPSYRNTDAQKWGTNPWELAKCFMSATGYSDVSSAAETDFSGMVNLIINLTDCQNVVTENLSLPTNIFCEARTIRNTILHSSTYRITDKDLMSFTDNMIQLLSDGKFLAGDSHAMDAIDKLSQIKTGSLTVSKEDETKLRTEALKAIEQKRQEVVKDIQKEKRKAVKRIIKEGEKQKELLNKKRLQSESEQSYLTDKKNLQRKLIEVYRENMLAVPIYPLMSDEDEVKIADLYAEPSMELADPRQKPKEDRECITSYHNIFHKDSHLCKKIYITGDAGMGKSALCQKMVDSWCIAHSSQENHDCFSEHEHTMFKFDFLFYISLRNALSYCSVEEMIKTLIQDKYHALLSSVLEDDSVQCLIILDGLDEWTPPNIIQTPSFVSPGLPTRKITNNCSILTTSRPWKLEVLRIRSSEIDRQIKLTGLDLGSSREFIKSIVAILNKQPHTATMNAEDFEKELKEKHLGQFRFIPVMLKQLICLWHDGRPLGDSQCDLYSGMIDLLFELAEVRLAGNQDFVRVKEEQTQSQRKLPSCFANKLKCLQFSNLLYSLSRMSFETLLNTNRELSLVFDSSTTEMYGLSKTEIDFCLKVGILSQSKVIKGSTSRLKSLSFIHKSFQEFLAALFVSMSTNSTDTHLQHIFSICGTLDICLEMEKILVFLSGLLPQVAFRLSEHISDVAAGDKRVLKYRSSVGYNSYEWFMYTMQLAMHVQSLILDCVGESSNPELKIQDIFIHDEDKEARLEPLIIKNITIIKSLHTGTHVLTSSLKSALMQAGALQKLVITWNKDDAIDYNFIYHMVTKSQNTLTSLVLSGESHKNQLKPPTQQFPTMLDSLCLLEGLYLENIKLPHDQVEWLMDFLSQRTQMKLILLNKVECSDCSYYPACRYQLDLSRHTRLQRLKLDFLFVEKVLVDTTDMEMCEIVNLYQPGAMTSVLRCLHAALKLQLFYCSGCWHAEDIDALVMTVPVLVHLKSIELRSINFGERQLKLSPEMRHLETVRFNKVTMTSEAWRCFIDSIPKTQKSVQVCLDKIKTTTAGEASVVATLGMGSSSRWMSLPIQLDDMSAREASAIREYVRSSPRFVVTEDRYDNIFGHTISFHTLITNNGKEG